MATITATPRPRPDTPQRVVPPRTTPELLATIKIELIYTFISETPITDQKPNSMDQVSAGMEEWDMANHTWRYCYQCDFYALSGFHLIYIWKWGKRNSRRTEDQNSLGQEADEGRCRCSDSRGSLALFVWPRASRW